MGRWHESACSTGGPGLERTEDKFGRIHCRKVREEESPPGSWNAARGHGTQDEEDMVKTIVFYIAILCNTSSNADAGKVTGPQIELMVRTRMEG